VAQESLPTAPNPKRFIDDLVPRLRKLIKMRPEITCEGIGVSLPGRVDLDSQRLVFAPNLAWGDFDLKTPIEQATGLPVELENAANSCALAEIWFGQHAEGVRNLVAVTVSEGIGTGLILNHQLIQGSTGMAGEFGHTTIVEDGLECRCGNRGCWEVYASNAAAVRYYTQSGSTVRSSRAASASVEQTLTFDHLLRLAEQSDPKAVEAINEMARYLGMGIARLVTGLAPDVIVVIGEVTRVWNRVGPIISETVKSHSFTRATTQIVSKDPSSQPRLRGTIAVVLQKHFGAPSVA
jgi:predicted NBD/HSP70 family sugar kinase